MLSSIMDDEFILLMGAPVQHAKIAQIKDNFCNLRDSEDIPIDFGFIDDLIFNNPSKAADWVSRLIAAGSTHADVGISGDYKENLGWIAQYPIPGHDWVKEGLDKFSYVLDYLLERGLIPHIHLACDGQSPAGGGYSDPNGLTYGWQWGMNHLPMIIGIQLKKYLPLCLWNSGYDGCFPNWTPDQTIQWIKMMKGISSEIKVATEFGGPGSVGYAHMGKGAGDWTADKLGMLDAFCIEVMTFPPNTTGVQQTAARLLGPNKKNIDPENDGPDYLASVRGPNEPQIILYEDCAYQAIRKQISEDDARNAADLCAWYGFKFFGNGQPH